MRREVETVASKIGRRIQIARELRGLSPDDLATWAEIPLRKLEQYEAGIGQISVDELEHVARTLRFPFSHFLEDCHLCGSK